MQNTYLLAVDQFDSTETALEFAASLVVATASEIRVVHVREVPAVRGGALPLETTEDARAVIEHALAFLTGRGIRASGRVVTGLETQVPAIIVQEAADRECQAIIMGSRRLHGLGRLAGHGVRSHVLRLTVLPVMTAPPARERLAS
ncbi:MAG: universal stress protein [Acidimicrobiales bacterium]|jgi:nucleotide-binding universal stress UspA family protein